MCNVFGYLTVYHLIIILLFALTMLGAILGLVYKFVYHEFKESDDTFEILLGSVVLSLLIACFIVTAFTLVKVVMVSDSLCTPI